MRIWSIHPEYLDAKGLVALWRETLLAKNVLEGKTKGYKNHPQLDRFKNSENTLGNINYYLVKVYEEAVKRGYSFDKKKIDLNAQKFPVAVTNGQLRYEFQHLLAKLNKRDPEKHKFLYKLTDPKPHPLFNIVEGEIESWEKPGT